MSFIGRWLSDAVRFGTSLVFAIGAMQIPALTHDYVAALLQVAQDARRDIEQRETSARQYYHLAPETDDAIIAALQPLEPSNARTLRVSVDRAGALRAAYDRISAAPPLLEPVIAVTDAADDPNSYKEPVLRTALVTFSPEVIISTASTVYGLAGLVIGAFVAQLVISALNMLANLVRARSVMEK